MKQELFTKVELSDKTEATIYEGCGIHFFSAMEKTQGNTGILMKYLILELVHINGKLISEHQLNQMSIKDISYLATVIGTMLNDDFI